MGIELWKTEIHTKSQRHTRNQSCLSVLIGQKMTCTTYAHSMQMVVSMLFITRKRMTLYVHCLVLNRRPQRQLSNDVSVPFVFSILSVWKAIARYSLVMRAFEMSWTNKVDEDNREPVLRYLCFLMFKISPANLMCWVFRWTPAIWVDWWGF